MNQHGSFSSYCHIGVCIILKEVIQISKRFLLTLKGSWQVIGLFFKRNFLMPHMLPIPTIHWTHFLNEVLSQDVAHIDDLSFLGIAQVALGIFSSCVIH
jgi:hypothetical protein